MGKESRTVSLPEELVKKIEERIKTSEQTSIVDHIIKVLEEDLSKGSGAEADLNKEDEEKVKERLKALGYMD